MKQRLAKYLAHAGVASRRRAEEWIRLGSISVNGHIVTNVVTLVDPMADKIEVEGKRVRPERLTYAAFNKPRGVMTTLADPHSRNTLSQWLPPKLGRVYPVGRLDKDSTGLLLLTNDGELANRLIHPRYKVPKMYRVEIKGAFRPEDEGKLERGIVLEEGRTLPCRMKILSVGNQRSELEFELMEGKKRQIRRMLEAIGYEVKFLHRISIGPIEIGNLQEGKWRLLSPGEIHELKKITGLAVSVTIREKNG
ncbi:MAG: rRNA pseudouridine synthase [Candidatus Omnitrophica bacterium]|nr:rRNA pseudouridine synthase [Candidatus Omnitrophota bacterium]